MEQLKDYSILDIEAIDDERFKKEKAPGKWVPESRVYLKSEADRHIQELEEAHKTEVDTLLVSRDYCKKAARTLRMKMNHHARKRCIAMAKWCRTSARYDESVGAIKYRDWYWKWFKRWLELADKFKNETTEVSKCRPQESSEAK